MLNGSYLDAMDAEPDKIKIFTGIRGCGKSFLLRAFACRLQERGADGRRFIYIDLENFVFSQIQSAGQLKKYILNKIGALKTENSPVYVFLDEVQHLSGWEKTLTKVIDDGLCPNVSFFAALSFFDSAALSRKVFLKNRYVEFKLRTLSFKEYQDECLTHYTPAAMNRRIGLLRRAMELRILLDNIFERYVDYGGFPDSVFCKDVYQNKTILKNIFSSIMYYDVILKNKVRYPELLNEVARYVFENIGAEHNQKKFKEYIKPFTSKKRIKFSPGKYLNFLEKASLLTKVTQVNLKTGKIRKTNAKYYLKEHPLIYVSTDPETYPVRNIFENILINELERRSYSIYAARSAGYNIDFAAKKDNIVLLIQTVSAAYDDDADIENKIKELCGKEVNSSSNEVLRFIVVFERRRDDYHHQYKTNSPNAKTVLLQDFLTLNSY